MLFCSNVIYFEAHRPSLLNYLSFSILNEIEKRFIFTTLNFTLLQLILVVPIWCDGRCRRCKWGCCWLFRYTTYLIFETAIYILIILRWFVWVESNTILLLVIIVWIIITSYLDDFLSRLTYFLKIVLIPCKIFHVLNRLHWRLMINNHRLFKF